MMALTLFGLFFLLIFLNVPIAVSLGLSALVGLKIGGFSFDMFPNTMYAAIGKFALLAIPFFILAGVLMDYAGISKRLVRFAQVCVGHSRSGLIAVTVVVSCFFAAISGSGPATVAALGSILIPAMADAGYDRALSTALMSASGAIGIIIPPSIAYVVYASIADVSVASIFTAGIIPGIVLGAAYIGAAMWASRNNNNIIRQPKASGKEVWSAFKDAIWGLLTPVIILGGIYGGIFTPTEAAAVAVVYGAVVGIFVYKEIKISDLKKIIVDAAVSSGTVMYIVACASVFAWILTTSRIANNFSEALMAASSNKYVLLLIMNIIFLIAGCFLDANSAFYILLPVMIPVCKAVGIDLVHFGVVITVNMAIGLITPPVGVNLYVGSSIGRVSVTDLCKKIIPFIIAGVITLMILSYIPQITMFLPGLMK